MANSQISHPRSLLGIGSTVSALLLGLSLIAIQASGPAAKDHIETLATQHMETVASYHIETVAQITSKLSSNSTSKAFANQL